MPDLRPQLPCAEPEKPKNATGKSIYNSEGQTFGACSDKCCTELQMRIYMEDPWGKLDESTRVLKLCKNTLIKQYNDTGWENPSPDAAISKFMVIAYECAGSLRTLIQDSGFERKNPCD